jgi:hypothetical protein
VYGFLDLEEGVNIRIHQSIVVNLKYVSSYKVDTGITWNKVTCPQYRIGTEKLPSAYKIYLRSVCVLICQLK